jgi:hypothetical protein
MSVSFRRDPQSCSLTEGITAFEQPQPNEISLDSTTKPYFQTTITPMAVMPKEYLHLQKIVNRQTGYRAIDYRARIHGEPDPSFSDHVETTISLMLDNIAKCIGLNEQDALDFRMLAQPHFSYSTAFKGSFFFTLDNGKGGHLAAVNAILS